MIVVGCPDQQVFLFIGNGEVLVLAISILKHVGATVRQLTFDNYMAAAQLTYIVSIIMTKRGAAALRRPMVPPHSLKIDALRPYSSPVI